MRKKIVISLLTVLFLLIVWQFELIRYGLAQGQGQWRILRNVEDTEEVLNDPDFPDSLKFKLRLINRAKEFAVDDLGLKESENYTSYFDEGEAVTLWNVSACEPFRFEPKTWWFPFVGEVPYMGYFEKKKAMNLVRELEEQGLDARMRPVGGWSTLGWFRDPILSSMLRRSEGQLAELIIHELTHGTIFVKDQVTFNENLASFIGEQGAIAFLKKEFGDSSTHLSNYLTAKNDGELFTAHILRGTDALDRLYTSFLHEPDSIKLKLKGNLIQEICESVDTLSFTGEGYSGAFQSHLPNNAYFMSFVRYHSAGDSLDQVLLDRFGGNLEAFVADAIDRFGH